VNCGSVPHSRFLLAATIATYDCVSYTGSQHYPVPTSRRTTCIMERAIPRQLRQTAEGTDTLKPIFQQLSVTLTTIHTYQHQTAVRGPVR
jgi:hypothetical protein